MVDLRERASTTGSLALAAVGLAYLVTSAVAGGPLETVAGLAMLFASTGVVFVGEGRDCLAAAVPGLAALALSATVGCPPCAAIACLYLATTGVTWVLRPRGAPLNPPSTMSPG